MAFTADDVRNALKKVIDPEIHINVVDLGMVYGVDVAPTKAERHRVTVKTTLTTPACPYGPALLSKMHAEVAALPQVSDVDIDLVWTPPWDPRTMPSAEARLKMGFLDFDDLDDEEAQAVS